MWSGIETFTESMFVVLLLEQLAPVLVDADLREALLQPLEPREVDVGDGDELERRVLGERHQVAERLAGRADARVAQRRGAAPDRTRQKRRDGRGRGDGLEELSAGNWMWDMSGSVPPVRGDLATPAHRAAPHRSRGVELGSEPRSRATFAYAPRPEPRPWCPNCGGGRVTLTLRSTNGAYCLCAGVRPLLVSPALAACAHRPGGPADARVKD